MMSPLFSGPVYLSRFPVGSSAPSPGRLVAVCCMLLTGRNDNLSPMRSWIDALTTGMNESVMEGKLIVGNIQWYWRYADRLVEEMLKESLSVHGG